MIDKDMTTAIPAKPPRGETRFAKLTQELGSLCHPNGFRLPGSERINRSP